LAKLGKGRFYKPEVTPFGQLKPLPNEVIKDFLEEKGRITGYITGFAIFNRLGLTTQVNQVIQIGRNQMRPPLERNGLKISFVLQNNLITPKNIPLLQILDAIKYIKKIPDSTPSASCERLLVIMRNLNDEELQVMVRLAIKYPPATRALAGALLEELNKQVLAIPLFKTLNPFTKFKISNVGKVLTSASKWNIE
jgi:hypothetical protein